MKLTKSEFKTMIKECIKELIGEGAFDQALQEAGINSSTPVLSNRPNRPLTQGKKPAAPQNQRGQQLDENLRERVRQTASAIVGKDDFRYGPSFGSEEFEDQYQSMVPLGLQKLVESAAQSVSHNDPNIANQYAEIFADTAMHTLPKQMSSDPQRGGYAGMAAVNAHVQVEKVREDQLQSLAPQGDMSHWAMLAFGGAGGKK